MSFETTACPPIINTFLTLSLLSSDSVLESKVLLLVKSIGALCLAAKGVELRASG